MNAFFIDCRLGQRRTKKDKKLLRVLANTAANRIDAGKERIESRGELGAVTLGKH
jgi:hypothetical protein